MPNVNVSLSAEVHSALEQDARTANLRASDQAVRIVENHLIARGLLNEDVKAEIALARSLVDRAVEEALRIVEREGFRPSITFDAIQAVCRDASWLQDYSTLIQDDPFKTGSPRKQTINQNLGYFIKKAVGANSVVGPSGRPINTKVKGSIIQSYTPLAL